MEPSLKSLPQILHTRWYGCHVMPNAVSTLSSIGWPHAEHTGRELMVVMEELWRGFKKKRTTKKTTTVTQSNNRKTVCKWGEKKCTLRKAIGMS